MTIEGHHRAADSGRQRLPNRRPHALISFEHDGIRYTAGLGHFPDGRLAEIFLNVPGKVGTAIEAIARDQAIAASIGFQHGVSAETLRKALTRDTSGAASGVVGVLLDLLARETSADAARRTADDDCGSDVP